MILLPCSTRQVVDTRVMANKGKKTDIGKQGLSSIKNMVVKNNLMGISTLMDKKGWVDSQGRKGKVQTYSECSSYICLRGLSSVYGRTHWTGRPAHFLQCTGSF